jgi:hypothetical protein
MMQHRSNNVFIQSQFTSITGDSHHSVLHHSVIIILPARAALILTRSEEQVDKMMGAK